MKSLLQKSMVLALSALLVSETVQAGFTGSAKAAGVIQGRVRKALDAYKNPQQPDLNALQQMMTDAQSIRPGITNGNGYTPKEWDSLKLQFYTKTGINLEADPAQTDFAFNSLLATLQRDRNGNVVDTLATPTVKGAQDFQAAWQAFLNLGGNGSLFPEAREQAGTLLGRVIATRGQQVLDRDQAVIDLQQKLEGCDKAVLEAQLQLDACLRASASQNTPAVLNTVQKQLKGLVTTAKQFPTLFVNTSLVDFTNADLSMSVTNALTKDMSLISGRITTLEAKAKEDGTYINNLKGQKGSLEKDVAELQKKLDACLAKDSSVVNKAAQEQIAQLQQQIAQLQTTNGQVNQTNAQLEKENKELHAALEQSTTHMANLTAQLQALQAENAQLRNARQGK